jgi:hypothetical protein
MRQEEPGRSDLIGPLDCALRDLPVLHLELLARLHQGTLCKEPETHARPVLPSPAQPRREGSREPGDQEDAAWPPPDTRC